MRLIDFVYHSTLGLKVIKRKWRSYHLAVAALTATLTVASDGSGAVALK